MVRAVYLGRKTDGDISAGKIHSRNKPVGEEVADGKLGKMSCWISLRFELETCGSEAIEAAPDQAIHDGNIRVVAIHGPPCQRTCPAEGSARPVSMRGSVDFPHPDGPSNVRIRPG